MSPHLLARSVAAALLAGTALAQITPGNLVVVRSGDGSAALSGNSTAGFVDEYTTAGTLVQTFPLPILAVPPQRAVTLSGNATTEGMITQSADGRFFAVAGYDTPPGSVGTIPGSTSAAVPRSILRLGIDGSLDSTTSINNLFSAGNPRSVVSDDGSQFWVVGSNSGVVYTTLGATTGLGISTGTTNLRVPGIFNGQLYQVTGSGSRGVFSIGTGLPTTAGQAMTILNGMTLPATAQPCDFYFADAQTVYVSDDRSIANGGGIQKWTESAGTWSLAYTMQPSGTAGCRGLTGIRDLTGTTLFTTLGTSSANALAVVFDSGASSTFTTIATAATNTAFRGVRFVRTPNNATIGGIGCAVSTGDPTIGTAGGRPVTGNANFGLAVGNTPPFSLYITIISIAFPLTGGVPLSIVGGPPCSTLYPASLDILLAGVTDLAGAGVAPLGLPNPDPALWGLVLGTQHLVFDTALYGAFGLPVGNSPGLEVTIGN